jgi:hypothetical protein
MKAIDRRIRRLQERLAQMRRWGTWSSCSGHDVGVVQKRAASRLKCGHANGMLTIKMDQCPVCHRGRMVMVETLTAHREPAIKDTS